MAAALIRSRRSRAEPVGAPQRDRSLLAALVIGSALGAFSVIADGAVASRTLVILGNTISPWAIAAFAVGRLSPSWKRGGWAGAAALSLGVVVYYVGHGVRLAVVAEGPATPDWSAVPLVWLVVAVTIGPLLGAAGAVSKRRPAPVLAVALPCVVLLAEAGFLVLDRRPWLWDLAGEPHRFSDLAIMVGLVAAAVVMPMRMVPDRRRRLLVHGLTLGVAALGTIALVGLSRVLVHLA